MSRRFDDVIELFDEVESLVASFWEFQFPPTPSIWSPETDVFQTEDCVRVIVQIPGVARRDLKIAVSPVLLEVTGTRPRPAFFSQGQSFYELGIAYGVFRKRIALPCRVDPQGIRMSLREGLLMLRLPRAVKRNKKGE
jgi:HSP20 family protein